jgi:hypothetical protein
VCECVFVCVCVCVCMCVFVTLSDLTLRATSNWATFYF